MNGGAAGPGIIIRAERPEDRPGIARLVTAAFADAPHRSGTEAAIVDALRAANALTLSLVALAEGETVGHIAASPVEIAGEDGWYGIGPISVRPDMQGRGIGSGLVCEALALLRRSGARGAVVLGEPAYYRRFGFAHDPGLFFAEVPGPYFQALGFGGNALPAGEAHYHPAFGAGDAKE